MGIVDFKVFFFVFLFVPVMFCSAQIKKEYVWYDPTSQNILTLHNQIWTGSDITSFYDRLPTKAQGLVRKEVWNLSRQSAGLKLVFNTDAVEIVVRYTVSKSNYAMLHFPATGVSGLDLFSENSDGSWAWANGNFDFKDTITYTFTTLNLDRSHYKDGRNFHLYLPLYNSIKWLEVGVPKNASFQFVPVSSEKPIVVYGTSIAQGGCASRPGMAWTNILDRNLSMPIVNLGFSGNGRMEKEMVDIIIEREARIFVLDCYPNMGSDLEDITSKTVYAVKTIREKYPNTPIILVDLAHYTTGRLNQTRSNGILKVNNHVRKLYTELETQGFRHLYYLQKDDIGLDMNDSVDGTHPTDSGMLKYAKAYEKLIRRIIKQ